MNFREQLKDKKTVVLKIGTSSIAFPNGRVNLHRMERLVAVICRLRAEGRNVVLVSSGSIGVGVGKLGRKERPATLQGKQAAASVGQAVLMKMYQKFFSPYGQVVAQILLTSDVLQDSLRKRNAQNTFSKLLEMGVVPIVNENDSISTDEIEIGDNDTLSAMVATLCKADVLILMSDIDGLFTADPRKDPNAKRLSVVTEITPEIIASATGAGSSFGTGGMATKIKAALMCKADHISSMVVNADAPEIIFEVLQGKDVGTLFTA